MEAILPGSTYNQWCDCPVKTHQPLKRSSTSPTPFPKPSNDPAYVKYSEINVPDAHSKPPPIPERPSETIESTDSPYLTLLPPNVDTDKRAEVIASYSIEQLNLMIKMFEKNGDISSKQDSDAQRKRTCSEPGTGVVLRNNPISVSEQSSKHPSKGLYFSYKEISEDMKEPFSCTKTSEKPREKSSPTETHNKKSAKDSQPIENTAPVPVESKQEKKHSGSATRLSRQNAVRHSVISPERVPISTVPKSTLRKYIYYSMCFMVIVYLINYIFKGKFLRQQSSEEMLERDDKPEWSKAKLDSIDIEGMYNLVFTL